LKLSEFQKAADATDVSSRAPWVGLNQNLFGLTEKVGGMAGAMKRRLRDKGSYSVGSFRRDMEQHIGDALWYLSAVCTHFHLDLDSIAERTLTENRKRWGKHRDEQGNLFHGRNSDRFSGDQRFPEKMTATFVSTEGPNSVSWLSVTNVQINGVPFGDPVDDNSRTEDAYRFHDVLHFAFAAYLDWSPVVRNLLKNKRKSEPEIDKFDDGARARDTEEAVSNFIHHEARSNNYFKGAKHLSTEFLARIQRLVIDLEVRDRTAAEWEKCILAAYDVFRDLVANKGGYVDVLFNEPAIYFRKKET
jgi:hypothetical protein